MKNHKVPFSNNNHGYPMYFQSKVIDGNTVFDICHNGAIKAGDTFQTRDNPQEKIYQISDVINEREPAQLRPDEPDNPKFHQNVNHHPTGVKWMQIVCNEIKYVHELHSN